MHIPCALLVSLAGFAAARRAADLDISPDEARKYGCSETCLRVYHETRRLEQQVFGVDFDFDFYETAANLSGSRPGDVLKMQALDPSTLAVSPGTTAYRMQYTSEDLDGSPVPVTGFIAFPYTAKRWRRGGASRGPDVFRLAAWAHGTTGIYAGCAPSNGPTLYHGPWQALVNQGYAVVATDYAGIGNNFTGHKYLSFSAQAADVYYSVVAAKKAFGHLLSRDWVGVGHSQGGGAVWRLSERPDVQPRAAGYLGTVAISPATHVVDMLLKNLTDYPIPSFVTVVPEVVGRAVPSYDRTFLTPRAQGRVDLARNAQVCFASQIGLAEDLSRDQVVDHAALERDMPVFENWQRSQAPALGAPSSSPVLVIHGQADRVVPQQTVREAWARSCASGNEVHLSYFPGMGHGAVVEASMLRWMDWIDGLFSAERATANSTCSLTVEEPFDAEHMRAPLDVLKV
ncbi:uncharacterized protein MAM_04364 [Metarhizium album ARSEF 1941]|uniref:Serine aminopeptidase S33 domain-containing protein n=1 Tax=Metarhizium album (strain ARSEF 1941) TaxID=1081103 RepID=A0A0B2WYP6_METAS|nr:uncharacterized protein MAM_04364 [Metarhizium album ARSEF 1941]KHN97975.1 hypothetical protein MAM_04364 [Metarhizium album ARSEF 1941]